MARTNIPVVPGTLELLVLKALASGDALHGFGVLAWLRAASGGELEIEEGALYPALHRMERKRWIAGEWGVSEKGRRARYYTLTKAGRAELVRLEERWTRYIDVWQRIVAAGT